RASPTARDLPSFRLSCPGDVRARSATADVLQVESDCFQHFRTAIRALAASRYAVLRRVMCPPSVLQEARHHDRPKLEPWGITRGRRGWIGSRGCAAQGHARGQRDESAALVLGFGGRKRPRK